MHSDQNRAEALMEVGESIPSQISARGVVVVSSTLQVLYMSGGASDLLKSLQQAESGLALPGLMPTVVEDFSLGVLKAMEIQTGNAVCEVTRLSYDPERPIRLRGFGLRGGVGMESARVVIIMEERSGQC